MSIYQTGRSPYWQFDFQRDKRRFHGSTGCTTRRDAERFEAELKRKVALGETARSPINLNGACYAYWQATGQHESNHKTTGYQIENLCKIIGPNRFLADIGMKHMREFVAKRRAQDVSNASINREISLAQRVWKMALSNGHDVPMPGTKGAIVWSDLKLDEPKERVRELSASEERRLFEHLSDDLAAVVRFAIMSGQRRGAIIGLRWDRVDMEAMRATVHTKGDQFHTFPLTLAMMELILDRPVVDGCPYVFTYRCARPAPKRPDRPRRLRGQRYAYSEEGWKREWGRALTAAEITDFRFHDLRHTSATRVLRSSGNLKAAQRLLGHSNISTTGRYAHVLDEDLRSIMSATESRNSPGHHLAETRANARVSAEESDT
jgi:integrase